MAYKIKGSTRKQKGCKHRYVNVFEDDKLICAWCRYVFQNCKELEEEYKTLGVPYKYIDPEKRDEDPDYIRVTNSCLTRKQSANNRLKFNYSSSIRFSRV